MGKGIPVHTLFQVTADRFDEDFFQVHYVQEVLSIFIYWVAIRVNIWTMVAIRIWTRLLGHTVESVHWLIRGNMGSSFKKRMKIWSSKIHWLFLIFIILRKHKKTFKNIQEWRIRIQTSKFYLIKLQLVSQYRYKSKYISNTDIGKLQKGSFF